MKLSRAARLLAAGGLLAACAGAHAVVTYFFNGNGARSVTLRVGSDNNTVNTVTFDVNNASVAPSPAPVQGTPGNGATPTSPTGGILIQLDVRRRAAPPDSVTLTVNSSAGMLCVSGPCTANALTIPLTHVGWTSYDWGGGGSSGGIATGSFNGGSNQLLFSGVATTGNNGLQMQNVLVFSYDNSTLYPSGSYRGRVVYTATVP